MTCKKCERHYLSEKDRAGGVHCGCPETFHCPCEGACSPGCACERVPSIPPPKGDGKHDFAGAGLVRYCRRCAKANVPRVTATQCVPLPPDEVDHRLRRVAAFWTGLKPRRRV